MNELNQNVAENLAEFLLAFRDDVVRGLQEYLNSKPALEVL